MQITEMLPDNKKAIHQAADLLVRGFREHWPDAWPDMAAAMNEVQESFSADRINRIATDDNGEVLGWIGGISQYRGRVWELHPLVVSPEHQKILLDASVENSVNKIFWFLDGKLIWSGDPEDKTFVYPEIGEHTLVCQDDHGRCTCVKLVIR